jgi:hypothetical protein
VSKVSGVTDESAPTRKSFTLQMNGTATGGANDEIAGMILFEEYGSLETAENFADLVNNGFQEIVEVEDGIDLLGCLLKAQQKLNRLVGGG